MSTSSRLLSPPLTSSLLPPPLASRWCKGALSSAAVHLAVYFPFWSLYMGTPAYGFLVMTARGETPTPLSVSCTAGSHRSTTPRQCGWLGALSVIFAGPGIIIPSYVLWGAEYGSVWCWSASVGLLTALLEPWVVAMAARGYERAALKEDGDVNSKSKHRAAEGTDGETREETREEAREEAALGRRVEANVVQPLWHFVMSYAMTPQQRLEDWRSNGPLRRYALNHTSPFEPNGMSPHEDELAEGEGGGQGGGEGTGCVTRINSGMVRLMDGLSEYERRSRCPCCP